MHQEPVDLSSLHPARDPARWEAMVANITSRALTETAVVRTPLAFVAGWMRPTLAAAALVAAVSLGVLSADRGGEPRATATAMRTVADELNFPAPVAEWIAEDRAPSGADLIQSLEGELP